MLSNFSNALSGPLFNILFIVTLAWSTAVFLERFRIPLIIGELIAGVIIGPAFLNIIKPSQEIFLLADLGMFFLIFHAGLETKPNLLKKFLGKSFSIGLFGILAPFAAGFIVSYYFTKDISASLLMAAIVSGTSMVTKSRIIEDFDLVNSPAGHQMMGASIFDNIFSLLILSFIIKSFEQKALTLSTFFLTSAEVLLFLAIAYLLSQIIFSRFSMFFSTRRGKGFTFALIIGLLFSFFAEVIHLPFILGAYLAGLFVKNGITNSSLLQKMDDRFLAIAHGFLGPIFIMSIAFRIDYSIFRTSLPFIFLLCAAAFIGKFIGVYFGSSLSRNTASESAIMGIIMNSRGAIELVLATIALELGMINQNQLSILVAISFLTTIITPLFLEMFIIRSKGNLKTL